MQVAGGCRLKPAPLDAWQRVEHGTPATPGPKSLSDQATLLGAPPFSLQDAAPALRYPLEGACGEAEQALGMPQEPALGLPVFGARWSIGRAG